MKKSYIYAGVTVLIWSTLATVVKLVLQDIPNLQALTISSAFAFVFLLILNIINGSIKEMKHYRIKDCLTMAGLGFLGLFMYSALYYYGIAELGSQEACILNYLWPMMIVIFACIILKERITVKTQQRRSFLRQQVIRDHRVCHSGCLLRTFLRAQQKAQP